MKLINLLILILLFYGYACLGVELEDLEEMAVVDEAPLIILEESSIPPDPDYVPPSRAFPVELPIIGTINLEMVEGGFRGKFAEEDKKIELGPLALENMSAFMSFDQKLSVIGRATLFNQRAEIGLKESDLSKNYYVLGLTYAEADRPRLELIPGAPFVITETDVVLEKGEPLKLLNYTKIGQKEVVFTLTVLDKGTDPAAPERRPVNLSAKTETLGLAELLPRFKDTPLKEVGLKEVEFEFLDMLGKSPEKGFSVSGTALAKQLIPQVEMQDTRFKLTAKQEAVEFVLSSDACTVENVGAVKEAKITARLEKDKDPAITFSGILLADLAQLGVLEIALKTELKEGDNVVFDGALVKAPTIAGFKVADATFHYDTEKRTVKITGAMEAYGYKGQLSYEQTAEGVITSRMSIAEKEIRPFKEVPGFDHIIISSPAITLDKDESGEFVGVLSGFLNKEQVRFTLSENVAELSLSRMRLGGLVPAAKVPSEIDFTLVDIVVTVKDFDAPGKKPVGSFSATMPLSGPFSFVADATKAKSARLVGTIAQDGQEIDCRAEVPGDMAFGEVVKLTDFAVQFSLAPEKEPELMLEHLLSFYAPRAKEPVVFKSKLNVVGQTGEIDGELVRPWSDPLGIQNLTVEKARIRAVVDFPASRLADIQIEGDLSSDKERESAEGEKRELGIHVKGDVRTEEHSIVLTLPRALVLTKQLPGLKALRGLTIIDPKLIYSGWEYEDKEEGMAVKKGLNFSGALEFVGPLAPVAKIIKIKRLSLAGVVPPSADDDSFFSATIPQQEAVFGGARVVLQSVAGKVDLSVTLASIAIGSFIPQLKGTLLDGITLSDFKLELLDFVNGDLGSLVTAKAKVSQAPQLVPGLTLRDLSFATTFAQDKTEVALLIASARLQRIGEVKDAKITALVEEGKDPEIAFSGILQANIAQLGTLEVALSIDLKKEDQVIFDGSFLKPLSIAGFKLDNAVLRYNTRDESAVITGRARAYGYEGQLTYRQSSDGTIDARMSLGKKEIRPFAQFPGADHIVVSSPAIVFERGKDGQFKGVLSGFLDGVAVRVALSDDEISLFLERVRLSKIFPMAPIPSEIDVTVIDFTVGAKDLDAKGKEPSVFVKMTMPMSGPFARIAEFTKVRRLLLTGSIAQGGKEIDFEGKIPGSMKFGDVAALENLALVFSLAPEKDFQVGLKTTLMINLPYPPEFKALNIPEIKPLAVEAIVSFVEGVGIIDGTLKESFDLGIPGVVIKNPRVKAKINLEKNALIDLVIETGTSIPTQEKKVALRSRIQQRAFARAGLKGLFCAKSSRI